MQLSYSSKYVDTSGHSHVSPHNFYPLPTAYYTASAATVWCCCLVIFPEEGVDFSNHHLITYTKDWLPIHWDIPKQEQPCKKVKEVTVGGSSWSFNWMSQIFQHHQLCTPIENFPKTNKAKIGLYWFSIPIHLKIPKDKNNPHGVKESPDDELIGGWWFKGESPRCQMQHCRDFGI